MGDWAGYSFAARAASLLADLRLFDDGSVALKAARIDDGGAASSRVEASHAASGPNDLSAPQSGTLVRQSPRLRRSLRRRLLGYARGLRRQVLDRPK